LLDDRLHVAPRHRGLAVAAQRQHLGLPCHERKIRLALEVQLLLQLFQRGDYLPRADEVQGQGRLGFGRLEPASRHRHVTPVQQLAQPITQLGFHAGEVEGQLDLRVEIAVVDGADLDPQPSPEHRPFGRAESRHASRHRL